MNRKSEIYWGISLFIGLLAMGRPVLADDTAPAADQAPPAEEQGWLDWTTMTGNWGGLRDQWADAGVTPGLRYIGEIIGNPSGGVHRGVDYEHQLFATLDFDFEKMAGVTGGTGHVGVISVNDHGPSYRDIGNALDVSNIEWKSQTRLWTAWYQQSGWDGTVSLRAGQLSTDDEFDVSATAGNFLNSTFGSNASVFANLPAGVPNSQGITLGPAYPLGAPGVRLAVAPTPDWAWLTGILSAQPASPDRNGLQFRVDGGALVISELQYLENQAKDATGLPAMAKIGFWYDTGRFNDLHLNGAGQSLAAGGVPRKDSGDYSLYGLIDRTVWQSDAGDALSLFARLNLVPQNDRNLVTFYIDGGVGYKGLIPGRDNDTLSLGVAYAKVGTAARALDADQHVAVRSGETAIELNYAGVVAPWWTLSPDLQYIINPAYGAADPVGGVPSRRIPDAAVLGVRTVLTF